MKGALLPIGLYLCPYRSPVSHSCEGVATERVPEGEAIDIHQPNTRHGYSIGWLRGKKWKSQCRLSL